MSQAGTAEPELTGSDRLHQCESTACRVIGGKAVVIAINRNQLHVLNAVGTRVWQLSDGRSLHSIIDTIVQEFEVERVRATADVHAFVRSLLAHEAARISRADD